MIWAKIVFGGLGRRGLEAIVAASLLALAIALVSAALMIVAGASDALARAERIDRPEIVHVKSRFNRALFETPRSGYLPPLTLPVYEPLIDPDQIKRAAQGATVIPRQSLFRNVVSPGGFLNVYIFGIDPGLEPQASKLSLARGRFLRDGDGPVAVLDNSSARALGVGLGDSFPVRKADGEDLRLTVVGILDGLELRDPPPRTVETPELTPGSSYVTSGVFVNLRASAEIFARPTLTDAVVLARNPADVPSLVDRLRQAFRLEPGVFVIERYSQFRRKVHDFTLTLALFAAVGSATAILAGAFVANLLHEVYADRRHQYAVLIALGFSPALTTTAALALGLATAATAAIVGSLVAVLLAPASFAMPSLMADLGTIQPRITTLTVGVVALVAFAAVVLAMAPTFSRLARRPLAASLSD